MILVHSEKGVCVCKYAYGAGRTHVLICKSVSRVKRKSPVCNSLANLYTGASIMPACCAAMKCFGLPAWVIFLKQGSLLVNDFIRATGGLILQSFSVERKIYFEG